MIKMIVESIKTGKLFEVTGTNTVEEDLQSSTWGCETFNQTYIHLICLEDGKIIKVSQDIFESKFKIKGFKNDINAFSDDLKLISDDSKLI